MKTKVALLVISLVIVAVIGTIGISSRTKQAQLAALQNDEDDGTLAWYVRLAKARGHKRITIPTPSIDYLGGSSSTTLADALREWSVIVAEPIRSVSVSERDRLIITWYKFRLEETLSKPQEKGTPSKNREATAPVEVPPVDSPADLSPVNDDEFLISRCGGSLTLDGVTLEESPDYPSFKIGHKYLLLVGRYSAGIAYIGAGPNGAFEVAADGSLKSLSSSGHGIKDGIENRYHNSLQSLRGDLKRQADSR
jgi:hypothetical protein